MKQEHRDEVEAVWPGIESCITGTGDRLSRLAMLTDFPWLRTKQFQNGQNISKVAKELCQKDGRTAVLLLTKQNKKDILVTDNLRVFVLPFPQCTYEPLSEKAAYAYVCRDRMHGAELALGELSDDDLSKIIAENSTPKGVATYLTDDPERWNQVADAVVELLGANAEASPELTDPENLDPKVVSALGTLIARVHTGGRRELIKKLMTFKGGVKDITVVFGDNIEKRLNDLNEIAIEYEQILKDAKTETDMQEYIEGRPWLLGLQYSGTHGRRDAGAGFIDFLLKRYDGGYDIVEMKGPNDRFIDPATPAERVIAPNELKLGPKLANALAQALNYKHLVQRGDLNKAIAPCKDPNILIVMGKTELLEGLGKEVFDQLKDALHQVDVITYDEVGKRALGIVENLRKYLAEPVVQ